MQANTEVSIVQVSSTTNLWDLGFEIIPEYNFSDKDKFMISTRFVQQDNLNRQSANEISRSKTLMFGYKQALLTVTTTKCLTTQLLHWFSIN